MTQKGENQQLLFYPNTLYNYKTSLQNVNSKSKANDVQYIQAQNEQNINFQQEQQPQKFNNCLKKQRRYWSRYQKQIYAKSLQQIYQEVKFKENKLSKTNLQFIANSIEKKCQVKRSISSINHFHNLMIKHYQTIDFIIQAFKHDQGTSNHDDIQTNEKHHRIPLKMNYELIDCYVEILNIQTRTNQSDKFTKQNILSESELKIIYMNTGPL